MSEKQTDPETTQVESEAPDHDVDPDTQSDPALGEGEQAEWASEGGAVDEGPATAVDDE